TRPPAKHQRVAAPLLQLAQTRRTDPRTRRAEDPADIMRGLPDFFRLHAIRAQLQDTFIHADVFETERSQTFLTRVTMRLAERGVAKLFQLQIDDRVAAARIGFELAGTRYLYYSG